MATEFFTRLQLKYDSYENWSDTKVTGQKGNLVLLAGEIGICTIPADPTYNGTREAPEGVYNPPHVMFKVGDGSTPFYALPWASAKAADVYAWAKTPTFAGHIEVKGTGNTIIGVTPGDPTVFTLGDRVEEVKAGNNGITIGGPVTRPTVGAKLSDEEGNTLQIKEDGLYVPAPEKVTNVANADYATEAGHATEADNADTLDGKHASDFATAEQGEKADSAVQSITVLGKELEDGDELTVAEAKTALGLGDMAKETAANYIKKTEAPGYNNILTKAVAQQTYVPSAIIAKKINGEGSNTEIPTTAAVTAYVKDATVGLTGAMHFVGVSTTDPKTEGATVTGVSSFEKGDVILYGNKEFVYDGAKWVELGDEGSLATGDQVNAALAEAKKYTDDEIAELGLGDMSKETAADYIKKTEAPGYDDILTKTAAATAYQPKGEYASAAQGALADTAVQTITDSALGQIFKKSGTTVTAKVDKDLATNGLSDVSIPTSGAVVKHVTARLDALDSTETGKGPVVTNVVQTDGKVAVTKGNITLDQVAANTKANYVIFNCGSSTEVI